MTATLTDLQFRLMDAIAHSEYNPSNGSTPESFETECPNTWFWADELAAELGLTQQAVGGVVTSLTEAGLIEVSIVTAAEKRRTGDDSSVWFTRSGWDAWVAARAAQQTPAPAAAPVVGETWAGFPLDAGLQFATGNPKRGASAIRWTAYRSATTVREFRDGGHRAADLRWDLARGHARLI